MNEFTHTAWTSANEAPCMEMKVPIINTQRSSHLKAKGPANVSLCEQEISP